MFGWGYVKDFCIALFQKEKEQRAIELYNAECLRLITENTAKFAGGSFIQVKLSDILDPKPKDERTADEIISHMREKLEKMK